MASPASRCASMAWQRWRRKRYDSFRLNCLIASKTLAEDQPARTVKREMKIIFSRKGFDSGSGGGPSPIIDGRPITLPIPTEHRSETSYGDLGLGDYVTAASKGRYSARSLCHHDPMFEGGRCAFGQTGAAQSHLANNNVGVGDVFLFFGLFAGPDGRDRHHRIFGYLQVDEARPIGANPTLSDQPAGFSRRHPHTLGTWNANDTMYLGRGDLAVRADESLRLSVRGGPVSLWRVPTWLRHAGLTYHGQPERWQGEDKLNIVARGQEFISDIGDRHDAHAWLSDMVRRLSLQSR